MQTEIKEFQQKAIDYENKINYFTIEIERLNGVIEEKREEVEEWRNKFSEINIQFAKFKEVQLIQFGDVRYQAEQTRFETEIKYLQGKLKEFENLNIHLKKELEEYKSFNSKRMLEIGDWKQRISSGFFDGPEDLRKSYEEYIRLKKVL